MIMCKCHICIICQDRFLVLFRVPGASGRASTISKPTASPALLLFAEEQEEHRQGYGVMLFIQLLILDSTTCSENCDFILINQWFFCLFGESGEDLFQIRGQNGILHNCKDPLPELSGKQEVADTANHTLETFYPISPTIDLQKVQVYQEGVNSTGEKHQTWPFKTLIQSSKTVRCHIIRFHSGLRVPSSPYAVFPGGRR